MKQVEYLIQFKEKDVLFEKEKAKGFYADSGKQKENVKILKYWGDNRFIISLKLKDDEDELMLVKGFDMNNPKDALNEIDKYDPDNASWMSDDDQFEMPKLHLNHRKVLYFSYA